MFPLGHFRPGGEGREVLEQSRVPVFLPTTKPVFEAFLAGTLCSIVFAPVSDT